MTMIRCGLAAAGVLLAAAAAFPALAQTAVATGSYECWAFSSARMDLNFTVTGEGTYEAAADGSRGTFSFDPASQAITFTGYLAEVLPDGFTTLYQERNGRPTVSFQSGRGAEAAFCERV